MPVFSWSFALSVLALSCSLWAIVLSGRKTPSAFAKACQKIATEVQTKWRDEVALFEATRERWTAEFAGIADRCDDTLERAETKRRRVAASESRLNGGGQRQEGDPYAGKSRADIIDAARAAARGRV